MIFDSHTHLFLPGQVGGAALIAAKRAWGEQVTFSATEEEHEACIHGFDGAIVLALDAPRVGMVVPNEDVAAYVAKQPRRLFGFASVDPNRPDAPEVLEAAIKNLGLVGLKLAPFYQTFYPDDRRYFDLYAKADELGLPILWHQGTSFIPEGFFDASRPAALDPIARAFPQLKMIIAHMGHPWTDECVAIVRKNTNMYMDVSALGSRPWQLYNALVSAMEYGVTDKILFGSDFPFFTTQQTIDSLRQVNAVAHGGMPVVSEEIIEGIIHRNTPEILGLV
jgi:predicted TIM-barrel fold metal-dependent hydrolase